MKKRSFVLMASCASLFSTLGASVQARRGGKFKVYNGREITGIIVEKRRRRMKLIHNGQVLRQYKIHLGFAPKGHKEQQGDGRTPEGTYLINRDNPNSKFHLSLGISYPNRLDREHASKLGISPGGDIFIHGGPTDKEDFNRKDWTRGCIAVSDDEIEDIFAMVKVGTPITIKP